ncbi:DUF1579 family protein [Mucilaginibacter sp. JRF]|uniref:DUF1579 family protein n=1 Tax=Mucilaginibacter sp. JRF TaxID=2780088 RepID=UPI00187F1F6C|nr:DUF1579 family protein [Mucilaginibacter sp. JRF]MBE9586763.1 DUF1579 family protein [Mucilaginibacter sp. JRF]
MSNAINDLSFLIGKWQTSGNVLTTADSPAITINGTDSYAWVSGGQFILHTVDVLMGDNQVELVEVIGYDKESNKFIMYAFDSEGQHNTMFATSDAPNELSITDENMRSFLNAKNDGKTMTALWERSDDSINWLPWMDMHFTKIS